MSEQSFRENLKIGSRCFYLLNPSRAREFEVISFDKKPFVTITMVGDEKKKTKNVSGFVLYETELSALYDSLATVENDRRFILEQIEYLENEKNG